MCRKETVLKAERVNAQIGISCPSFLQKIFLDKLSMSKNSRLQWSAVRVTAVTVTVGYSDSFGNPRFITNKTPLLTVTKNRLQWHLLPHFFRFLRHHMSKLTPEIDFLDNFTLVNRFLSSYWSMINGLRDTTENESYLSPMLMDFAQIWVIL